MCRCSALPVQNANPLPCARRLPRPSDSLGRAARASKPTIVAASAGGRPRRNDDAPSVPSVSPSFIIPPPARGSQYSNDLFGRDTSGGEGSSGNSGNSGSDQGGRGGGGNRGGAFNLFTGGFFGPGGRFSLLHRLRLLLVFWAWCTFMALVINSVVKLCLRAASSISLPVLNDEASSDEGHEEGGGIEADAGFMSGPELHTNVPSATDSPAQEGATSSQLSGAAASPSVTNSLRDSAVVAAEAVEVRELDHDQRAYLQLLLRHSQAKANPQEQPSMAAWSMGIYVAILGSVVFLSIVK